MSEVTVKLDDPNNPKEIRIDTETGVWIINAVGMQYKVKKQREWPLECTE